MTIVATNDTRHEVSRVEVTRITIIDVYIHVVEFTKDPVEVVHEFEISMGEVHDALAYYYNHLEEMHKEHDAIEEAHQEAMRECGLVQAVDGSICHSLRVDFLTDYLAGYRGVLS